MFEFQKFSVYIKAKAFLITSKRILSKTKTEKYVNDQLGRASYSIVLNIAEGSAKTSKADRKNYFTTARGSVFECVAILDIFNEEHILEKEHFENQLQMADELSRILYLMIKNLS